MYYRYEERVLKKLQQEEKEILRDFMALCDRHQISCFAVGGTMLGAVRHQGFIPWDDDIDIAMLREDYEKFLQIPLEEYGDKYMLSTPEKINDYYSLIPKFYKKNTKFITPTAKQADKTHMGIFIEIFVYENVSKEWKLRKKKNKKIRKIEALFYQAYVEKILIFDIGWKAAAKYLIKWILMLYIRLFGITTEKLCKEYLDLSVNRTETGQVAFLCYKTSEAFFCRKEELFPLKKVLFEDVEIYIPHNYEQILKQAYGDYMKIPSESERWNQAPVFLKFSDGEEIRLKPDK